MKKIIVIFGLLVTVAICQGQNTQSGWYNVHSLTRPAPTAINSQSTMAMAMGAQPFEMLSQPDDDGEPSGPIAEAITPDIQALADGLQDDPTRIFNYVHDHINYVLYFGSKKGAELTLLEKSGNDFDQCALLVALLRAAGYTNAPGSDRGVGYQFGWMLMPYDIPDGTDRDLHHWLQLTLTNSNWLTTSNYLYDLVDERGYPSYSAEWGNNVFSFQRVWVALTIGSTTYELDPAFKVYEPSTGINLASAMGFSSNALFTAAAGTDTGTYVSNLNEAAIRTTLTGYTTNLLNYIQSNAPNASVQDITGGWQITPSSYTSLPTNLIFTTTDFEGTLPVETWDYEPTNLMSSLTVTFGGQYCQLFMPQLEGQRLSLTFDTNGLGELWLDDNLLLQSSDTGSGSSTSVELYAHHPVGYWDLTDNTFVDTYSYDQDVVYPYQRTNATYALLYAFEPDWGWLQKRQNILDEYRQQGLSDTSRQVVSETLNIMGLNWMLQTEASQKLLCQQLNVLPMNLHRLGRMAQEGGKGYYVDAYMEEDADYPNSGVDAVSADHYSKQWELKNYYNSALEYGIIEQLQNTNLSAASTIKMLEIANTNKQAVYMAYYGNWSSIESKLSHYSTATLDAIVTNYIDYDDFVMLPQNGSNHVAGAHSWAGYGYLALGNTMAMLISGNYSGGFGALPNPVDISYVDQTGDNQPNSFTATQTSTPNPPTADPVDTADGTFQVEHTDLSLGQAEPRGITLSRYYNGTRRFSNPVGLGYGWIHNYYLTANTVAAPQAGLGGTTPAQMAAMLVASVAGVNFYNDSAADPGNWMTTALIAKWGVDQLTKSGVSVNLGKDTIQFVKQPNGTFTPPANCTMTLIQTNGSYWLQMRHGNTFKFNSAGYGTNIVDQYGNNLYIGYNSSNWVSTVKDWQNRHTFTFNYSGTPSLLTSVSDGTRTVYYGHSTDFSPQSDLTSFTDPEGEPSGYEYDTNHQITATLDAQDRLVISNLYNSQGRLTTQYTEGNTNKAWQIFWSDWATVEYDPDTGVNAYFYDDFKRLYASVNPMQDYNEAVYDGQNHIIYTISPMLEVNQYIYDGNNNVIETIDPLGFTNRLVYDGKNNLIYSIDPLGHTNSFGYNAEFSLAGQTNGAGDWVNYTYNASGSAIGTLASKTDAGGTTSYGYDSTYGQLTSITYPGSLGGESFGNDQFGDVTNHTDARGFATTFQYDNRRELTNTIAPTNLIASVSFDAEGNVASTTDARGNVTYNTWSATRKLLTTALPTVAAGTPVLTSVYDNRDWLAETLDPLEETTFYTNNAAHWLVSQTDPVLRTTTYGFDADGRKLMTVNAANETNSQTWDARSELIALTDGMQHTSLRAYDRAGNQITLTNRNGNVWQFQFDGANRLTNTIPPSPMPPFSQMFNHQGLLAWKESPSGHTNAFLYNGRNWLTNSADGTGVTTYQRDANGNLTNEIENGLANSWTFDAYNRVSSYKDVYGNLIQYLYDADGNLTNLVYPGGKNVYYTYDNDNQLIQVKDWSGRITTFGHDLAGHLTTITRPNGTERIISYNSAGQETNILEENGVGFPIALFRYNWNANPTVHWEFAAPMPHTNAPPYRSMTYNADNELATVDEMDVTEDLDGNLTDGPLTNDDFVNYTYDARNRLLNAGGVTNIYDAANNRIGQLYGTNSVSYVINPNAKLPQVLERIKNGVTTYYIYGAGLLYQVTETATSTNALYYHYDYRGSTIAVSDENGNVTDRMEYSLYATLTYHVGNTDTPFLFNGRYGVMTDPNGLLYMRARYYSPYLCRFVNPDPSGFAAGLNFYAYANGNPVSMSDPSGFGAVGDDESFSWLDGSSATPTDLSNPFNMPTAEPDDWVDEAADMAGEALDWLGEVSQPPTLPPLSVLEQEPAWQQGLNVMGSLVAGMGAPELGELGAVGEATTLGENDVVIGFAQNGQIIGQTSLGNDFATAMSHKQFASQLGILNESGVLSEGTEAFTAWKENGQLLIRGSNNFVPTISPQTQTLLQQSFR